ncbi:hypothetical protein [Clostridium bornimense]|nr:hypothetical protein [Clostridium bornimense]
MFNNNKDNIELFSVKIAKLTHLNYFFGISALMAVIFLAFIVSEF